MAFRVGKSVMLNFGDDLEPIFIFTGLAMLLLIGPLFRWYVQGMTTPNLQLSKRYMLELIPFVVIFGSSLFVTKEWYENSELVIIIFASGLIFIYLHFAFYILLCWLVLKRTKKRYRDDVQTKSQKTVIGWLHMLVIGFLIIWVSYVLNILDGAVPYVIGPIVYSLVIYFLSYKAYQLRSIDLDGAVFKISDNNILFQKISELVIADKLYLESDLSLVKLSEMLGQSTQLTSSIINQYAKRNFNDFINYYRIQDAKKMLLSELSEKYTISAIAFDLGFSSLSSFNSAFKKFVGTTPSSYRKSQV